MLEHNLPTRMQSRYVVMRLGWDTLRLRAGSHACSRYEWEGSAME